MSMATLERSILAETRDFLNNPKLRIKDIMEWNTAAVPPEDGEVCVRLPKAGVHVCVKTECDKRGTLEDYKPVLKEEIQREALTFGQAIEALKAGMRVAREGWNGRGMWIVLMTGMKLPPYSDQTTDRKVNDRTAKWIGEDTPLETLPYIAMWTVNAEGRRAWLPGWVASQTDILSEDWLIVG